MSEIIEATFEHHDPDVNKLITLASSYRDMVLYLLDNFVSKDDGETEDWMKVMDSYAFDSVMNSMPKKVELEIVKE